MQAADASESERERLRETGRRAEPFSGRADERIVNFICRTPQIRLTSSLTIKMIADHAAAALLLFSPSAFRTFVSFRKHSCFAHTAALCRSLIANGDY